MRALCATSSLLLFTACAGYDGRSLVPGRSTAADVETAMGLSREKRSGAGGETVLWYPRFPYGRVSYAARIGGDGRLIALEQRLTRDNVDKLKPGVTRDSDARDLLGPPYRAESFPRLERQVWIYPAQAIAPQLILLQFSQDGILREAYMIDDPDEMASE